MASISITQVETGVNLVDVTYEVFSQFTEPEIRGNLEISGALIEPESVEINETIAVPYDETGGTESKTIRFRTNLPSGINGAEVVVSASLTNPDRSDAQRIVTIPAPESGGDGGNGGNGANGGNGGNGGIGTGVDFINDNPLLTLGAVGLGGAFIATRGINTGDSR